MNPSRFPDLSPDELAVQDEILKYISSNFVSLNYQSVKYFKHHLGNVTHAIVKIMRREDELFNTVFQREHVAGSFWNKLKIGKPVEFDKNFVLYLPSVLYKNLKMSPASPSYVTVNVQSGLEALKSSKCKTYRSKWYDDEGNIISDEVRFWMESVIEKAFARSLSPSKDSCNKYILRCDDAEYLVGTRKSGPAITVEVEILPVGNCFSIDLVPAFEFQVKDWPKHIRKCPDNAQERPWHLVPKPLKPGENTVDGIIPNNLQWRLSFHDQESCIIHDLYHFKAVLKLLKKLRDLKFDQYTMSSYALKTVFMHEIAMQENDFWRQRLTTTFLHMLDVLTERYRERRIPFYWDDNHNLLGKLSEDQIKIVHCTLERISSRISDGLRRSNHFIIGSVLLKDSEFEKLKEDIYVEDSGNKLVARRL